MANNSNPPRRIPAGACTWCGHNPHTGPCPDQIGTHREQELRDLAGEIDWRLSKERDWARAWTDLEPIVPDDAIRAVLDPGPVDEVLRQLEELRRKISDRLNDHTSEEK
ncbi:hypothetical protein [Microlunatus parietis]|uniref:Uncharacterized protein n=1 Tax=Microlunatus parietis TaxID=682979 RepID=A0A7Y9I800_9ACTN|nr:hypothetical protein [Microlunatus parietis]NYE71887.1 hypothetical protein [Microlunatus parietis]